jgi:hypothetical protein
MIKKTLLLSLTLLLLAGCAQPTPAPTATLPPPTATLRPTVTATPLPPTATLVPTRTLTPTATIPPYPPEGRGPANFAAGVNPLTGLEVDDLTLLQRRPQVIKVENLPREHRPQFGLSLADVVYEYYTEQGSTRFAAVYYGQDAETVGPIRSGRFFDVNVVQMYKAIFVFGSAYTAVWNRFVNSDFANRLVIENSNSCPALCRYEQDKDLLVANTGQMSAYLKKAGINNDPPNLDGMFFKYEVPAGGQTAEQVFVRFSGAIYNRWDWDAATGRYLRFSETQNDLNRNNEQYAQLTDRLNNAPIAADTLVTICVPHQYYFKSEEIDVVDILPSAQSGPVVSCDGKNYPGGSGPAYVARDGQMYAVTWKREKSADLITLVGADGAPFPFKPGQTWFEVVGASSDVEQNGAAWKFIFQIVP